MATIRREIIRSQPKMPVAQAVPTSLPSYEGGEEKNKGGLVGGVGYLGEKVAVGAVQSIEGISDYVVGGIAKLFGFDKFAERQFVNDWFGDWYDHPDEWFKPSGAWKVAGDIAGGIGTSLPTLAVGLATAGTGVLAGATMFATAGLGAAGNATKEAVRETGKLTGKELAYGGLTGTLEGGLETVTNLIGFGTGAVIKSVGKQFGKEFTKKAVRDGVAITLAKSFGGEAFEEAMAEIFNAPIKRATYDPNAEGTTAGQVLYASFVGGMSGVVMGGAGTVFSNARNTARGKSAVEAGETDSILKAAKYLSEKNSNSNVDVGALEQVKVTYAKLSKSLEKTNGVVETAAQRRMLGELKLDNVAAVVQPKVYRTASNIINDPDAVVERINTIGYTDSNGNKVTVTKEMLLEGVDIKDIKGTLHKALQSNEILRDVTFMSLAGEMMLNTSQFQEAVLRGEKFAGDADLENFLKVATLEERRAMEELTNIPDLSKVDADTFNEKVAELYASGIVDKAQALYQTKKTDSAGAIIPENNSISTENSASLNEIGANISENGVETTEKTEAITDKGEITPDNSNNSVQNKGDTSRKALPDAETESTTASGKGEQMTVADSIRYANENIPEMKDLNAEEKARVRRLVRQMKSKGFTDKQIRSYARVSARSGIDIVVDKESLRYENKKGETRYADGMYSPKRNKIFVNPEGSRSLSRVLIHELTHAIYKTSEGKLLLEEGARNLSEEEKNRIVAKYFADDLVITKKKVLEYADELNAHYIEALLDDERLLEKLVESNPTLPKKILSFFKKAITGYSDEPTLSKEAKKLYKRYKQRFEIFSERSKYGAVKSEGEERYSYSSIAYSFFGKSDVSIEDFENGSYKNTNGYKEYVSKCISNMSQVAEAMGETFNEKTAKTEIEDSIKGIIDVAVAMKKAGYDIFDTEGKRKARDSKNRLLFSSLEPNSDYFTSHDISTICDKRINFAEIYDEIVRREEAMNVPSDKRFFSNVDNYFVIHKIMADKGLTQPCQQCYVESMRKNLAPMANAFIKLMQETNPNNKANDQLYQQSGKKKGELKSNNAKLREELLAKIKTEEYKITASDLTVDMLTTSDGLVKLKLQAPFIYEAFNSFYGQSKPKMPKVATPFRFGDLTALLTDDDGKLKTKTIEKIVSTGGFRLQSYSDFQIQNFADVLQVIFEAGTLGLNGHAYTKVPAFLDATKGTNLKRNISIFMYQDGNQWKIDRKDSFPYKLEEIYDIVKSDEQGDTSIIAVTQNEVMAAWVMANENIGYFIPFHKSGLKMGTVRDSNVYADGKVIKGYANIKDHTRQQTEVWAKTTTDHKAYTKVKKGINIYEFWDFDNTERLSKKELIEKNVKRYIDECEKAGYIPKFREYVMNNSKVLDNVLAYSKKLGFASADATIDDISFEHKGYRIPYGYYKCLGDFGMFKPNGKASPIERLSLKDYDFASAVDFFSNAESLRRNEILQQIDNGVEREKYISGEYKDMTTADIAKVINKKRTEVVEEVMNKTNRQHGDRMALPDEDIDIVGKEGYNYTKEQYEQFGWARVADALTKNEIDDLYSKIQARSTLRTFKRSSKGEAIVEVNAKPHTTLGVNNVFVFVKGTKNNFKISRVVRFDAQTEVEMEIYKEALYEGRTCSDTYLAFLEEQGITREYRVENHKSFAEYKRSHKNGETSRGTNQDNRGQEQHGNGHSQSLGENGKTNIRYALSDEDVNPLDMSEAVAKKRKAYDESLKQKLITAKDSIYIDTVDELYGLEKYLRVFGNKNKDAASMVQAARASMSAAQTMLGDVQKDIFSEEGKKLGDGLSRIIKPLYSRGEKVQIAFNEYLMHHLNVDRMSLEKKSLARLEEMKTKLKGDIKKLRKVNAKISELKAKKKSLFSDEVAQVKLDESLEKYEKSAKALKKDILEQKKQIDNFEVMKNKPIFGENDNRAEAITAEQSIKRISEIEKVHPNFKETAEKIWAYTKNLNHMRVEAGLISAESEAYMNELYPHYVPAYRDTTGGGIAAIRGKRNLAISSTVKTAKGSGLDVLDVADSIAAQTQEMIRAGRINQLFREVYEAAKSGKGVDYVEIVTREKVSGEQVAENSTSGELTSTIEVRPKGNQITGFVDGTKVTIKVSDELFIAFDSMGKPTVDPTSAMGRGAKKLNDIYKKLITSWSPAFLLRNPIRDIQDAGINSKHARLFWKNLPKVYKMMYDNSELWQEYRAYGGFSASIFGEDGFSADVDKRGFEAMSKLFDTDAPTLNDMWKAAKRGGKNIFIGISNLNAFIEQATRFAEYVASREAGDSISVSINNAAEVTTNFGRRGRLTKKLNATIMPFLNPAIQGFDKIFRNIGDAAKAESPKAIAKAYASLISKAAIIGLAPMIVNMLMYGDDEDYEKLREEDKENNFLIKVGDTFIKIPRGRVASVIGGTANRGYKLAKGENADLQGYFENAMEQVTPVGNMTRTIISPFFDVRNNRTWYGTEIEGRQWDNTSPKDRYDESTSSIAKAISDALHTVGIGKAMEISPKKVHYLLDQYSGVIGDFLLPATSKKAHRGFFGGNFTIDPATSNKLSKQFYDIYDKAQYAKTSGDDTAIYQVKYLNGVKKAISEMHNEKQSIQADTTLTNSEKLQKTRVVQILINQVYETAIADIEQYTKAFEATKGIESTEMFKSAFGEGASDATIQKMRYTEATRYMYGAKKALEDYDDSVFAKCELLNLAGIDYDNLYYYYFATKGITSDTDKAGNAISGSKRKKVIAEVNKLKISTEQKLLLIAAKGYALSEKDKRRLLNYILKLKTSRENREELAKMCGFKVKNGRIVVK